MNWKIKMRSAFLFLIVLFACNSKPPQVYLVFATELALDFQAGSVKYWTKPNHDIDLIVTGEVSRIDTVPFIGWPTVELAVYDTTAPGVIIYFTSAESGKVSRLRKNQTIAVKGRCVGIIDGNLRIDSAKFPWYGVQTVK